MHAAELERIVGAYDGLDMVTVYIAEAHAKDEWTLRSTSNAEQDGKWDVMLAQDQASRCQLAKDWVDWLQPSTQYLVDTMDDGARLAYGAWPERMVIVEDGAVQYYGEREPALPALSPPLHRDTRSKRQPVSLCVGPLTRCVCRVQRVRGATSQRRWRSGSQHDSLRWEGQRRCREAHTGREGEGEGHGSLIPISSVTHPYGLRLGMRCDGGRYAWLRSGGLTGVDPLCAAGFVCLSADGFAKEHARPQRVWMSDSVRGSGPRGARAGLGTGVAAWPIYIVCCRGAAQQQQ